MPKIAITISLIDGSQRKSRMTLGYTGIEFLMMEKHLGTISRNLKT